MTTYTASVEENDSEAQLVSYPKASVMNLFRLGSSAGNDLNNARIFPIIPPVTSQPTLSIQSRHTSIRRVRLRFRRIIHLDEEKT